LCPHCGSNVSKVLETRKSGNMIYRRRCCQECSKQFISRESAPRGLEMPESIKAASIDRMRAWEKAKVTKWLASGDVFSVRFEPRKDEE
jgi:transcriptional regulator NrdR family protein